MDIKYWKGKHSCPICGKLVEDEGWFVAQHMKFQHSVDELVNVIGELVFKMTDFGVVKNELLE